MQAEIHKSGLLCIRNGRILLCRKCNGGSTLILPGGKIEPGEAPSAALVREIAEELSGAAITHLQFLGSFFHPAIANFRSIQIELFSGELPDLISPSAEIAELVWFSMEDDPSDLAPSLRQTIFPALAGKKLLSQTLPAKSVNQF